MRYSCIAFLISLLALGAEANGQGNNPGPTAVTVTGPLHITSGAPATYTVTIQGIGTGTSNTTESFNWQAFDEDGLFDDDLTSEFAFTITAAPGVAWNQSGTFALSCGTNMEIPGTDEGEPGDPAEVFVLVERSGGVNLVQSSILQVGCASCGVTSVIFEGPTTLAANGTPSTYTLTVRGTGSNAYEWSVIDDDGVVDDELIGEQSFTGSGGSWVYTATFQLKCVSDRVQGHSPTPTGTSGEDTAEVYVLIELPILGTDCAGSPIQEVSCEACFLMLGFDQTWVPVPGHPEDVIQVVPLATWRVAIGYNPQFQIPNEPILAGFHLYTQVYMWNPYNFPNDPIKFSNPVDVCLGVSASPFGVASGMQLWPTGSVQLGGTFSFDFRFVP